MANFSERNGYTTASQVIIREQLPEPIINLIINWLDDLKPKLNYTEKCQDYYGNNIINGYDTLNYFANNKFFCKKNKDFNSDYDIIGKHIEKKEVDWLQKLNLIEMLLPKIKELLEAEAYDQNSSDRNVWDYEEIIADINDSFERNNFAYRIIDNKIVDIISKIEIDEIDKALTHEHKGVQTHLQTALRLLSAAKQTPEYRLSIKESISAVEACCRDIYGGSDLGAALKEIEKKVVIHPQFKQGLLNLYSYTNAKNEGIRHVLMDGKNPVTSEDAIFMLVACSAFTNYITAKNSK